MVVLSLNRAPRNVLTAKICRDLEAHLTDALADDTVRGIVISGQGEAFSTGMDLDEFAHVGRPGNVYDIGQCLDGAKKPVVAAIHGAALGAGLELALCTHARVAKRDTKIGMPDIAVGLIPGGGATQRLPRVIGAQASLELLLSGRIVPVTDRAVSGLMDRIVNDDPEKAALVLADLLAKGHGFSHIKDRDRGLSDPGVFQRSVAEVHDLMQDPSRPEADIVACVEAAQLLPFDQGLNFEAVRFRERAASPASLLARHAFAAKAKAANLPPALASSALPVDKVVVLGRSSEVADLAAMTLWLGHRVWIESGTQAMGEALAELTLKRLQRSDLPSDDDPAERLTVGASGSEMEEADLIFDTGELTPDPPVALKEGGVWLLTSPVIAAGERAEEVSAQGRTLRLRRLLRNAHLVELSAPPGTRNATVSTAHKALSAAGQSVIMTADEPGGLVGALFSVLCRATMVMLAAGQSPGRVERAARRLGLHQGPLQMMDVHGAGRSLDLMRRVFEHRDASLSPLRLLSDRIADATQDGAAKAARVHVFHVAAGQSFSRDPDLSPWIGEWRGDYPDRSLVWPDVPLEQAFHAALIKEAARLRSAKVIQRMSDIDLAAEKGLFMDPKQGGPLIQADMQGLLGFVKIMKALAPVDACLWQPDPHVLDMVKNGKRFF